LHLACDVLQSDQLTTIREDEVTEELYTTVLGRARLTPDNPLLEPTALALLDDRGLIRPGTVIRGDVASHPLKALCETAKAKSLRCK
jgi:DNA-directed RNA polymerase beta subunit